MPLPALRELNPAPRSSRIHVSKPEPDMNLAKEHCIHEHPQKQNKTTNCLPSKYILALQESIAQHSFITTSQAKH